MKVVRNELFESLPARRFIVSVPAFYYLEPGAIGNDRTKTEAIRPQFFCVVDKKPM